MANDPLRPEDYAEPVCLLNMEPAIAPVDQRRILEKLDEYLARRDYAAAEKHLKYWLAEARAGCDQRGELLVLNEMIGHYRKTGRPEEALGAAEKALRLSEEMGYKGSFSRATTCVNAATAYQAFGRPERALELFIEAKAVFEGGKCVRRDLMGGLYNNMGLTLASLGRYDEAFDSYFKALDQMAGQPRGNLESAVTYLNMANALEARAGLEKGEKQIDEWVGKACDLLGEPGPEDGYYAFVLEKCAPTIAYYGYFAEAEDMSGKAKRIYEGA